jgi:hypothetical protein
LAHSICKAEKKRTLDKAYKIKVWWYCEYLEEHIENLGNLWDQKNQKNPKAPKRSNLGFFGSMPHHLIG